MGSLYNLMKPYSEFRSKEEFNTYQKQVLKCYRFQLNKTDSIIIHFLGKYAVNEKQKTVGVACPLMGTIATNVGKSIRTVRRSIAKLEELGIIKRVATKERHKRGGYSANLYEFLTSAIDRMDDRMKMSACKTEDNATGCSKNEQKIAGETILSKNISQIKEKRKGTYELDETYSRHDIPKPFIYALVPMTSNPKKINIFWSKVELAYKKSGLLEQGVLLEQILADEEVYGNLIWRVKSVVRAYKYGEIRKDIGALLYSTVRDLFLEVGLEWGAALRRSKGISLFDPFKKEPCV
ncbi:helix-turn-helix domain-containing protein [Bacillus cereus]|uniref:helix-turn-helix domain-containing protein n=1 Tax=Bacillus cereus group TaxID=86661 RepID=UPI000BF94CE9|nr:helix-turn-helix domain-containing protein [Bacillus cereus]MDA2213530.1 helix-turn-helix domain-containing protein [Bacillus cereus]MDA2224777.1 helix-turn-helix domain-containing protein [Bacillus cereus]MDA2252718.1 helix-turn-helix domain-containing protein [Bacillus cereus]MDA2280620.1 helix-turn-helix domain-containing protein [Bacillus cereus]MDA2286111.1 helix-turn-helix domain-containing protein [Bacillus cereus]